MARLFKPKAAVKRGRASTEATPTQLKVDNLSHDGRGVARHEGKTVFVSGALPGETVSVSHYRRQKRYSECETRQVLSSSSHRSTPECEHYHVCGGCQLQHLKADQQLHYKEQSVLSLLQRQEGIVPELILEPVSSAVYGYRTRARFGVTGDGQLAFRQQGSDRLTPIACCPVLLPSLAMLLPVLQSWLNQLGAKSGVTHVELIAAEPRSGVLIRYIKPLTDKALLKLRQLTREADIECWLQGEKKGILRDLQGEVCDPRLAYSLPQQNVQLAFHPGDFTQVNKAVNQAMVTQAMIWLELHDEDCVADLFCGMGNFSIPMARRVKSLIGVEGVDTMVARAQQNSLQNKCDNTDFRALDLSSQALNVLLKLGKVNKLLLDPPRAGARYVCEQLRDTAVEKLVYVSCNPASLARDSGLLQAAGYRLQALRVLDMFPQTAHVETMALFIR